MVAVLRMDAYRVFLNPIIGLRQSNLYPTHFCTISVAHVKIRKIRALLLVYMA